MKAFAILMKNVVYLREERKNILCKVKKKTHNCLRVSRGIVTPFYCSIFVTTRSFRVMKQATRRNVTIFILHHILHMNWSVQFLSLVKNE